MRRMRAKRRTFQLVQHGIKSPILLELPPHAHAGALVQGQQLLNIPIVSLLASEVNDNPAKMWDFLNFLAPFFVVSVFSNYRNFFLYTAVCLSLRIMLY